MSEHHDLPLPARRPLPDDVRIRLRTTVLSGVRRPRSLLNRAQQPLAAAAVVAVLGGGVAMVAQSVTGPADGFPPTGPTSTATVPHPPPLDPVAAAADLDRCWAAMTQAGKAAGVPGRSTWRPVFAMTFGGITVTAARANGKPLFCTTTRTTVTVSDPNATPAYAGASRTGALLVSPEGALAGVVDPSWRSLVTMVTTPSGSTAGFNAVIQDGMFVSLSHVRTAGARVTVRHTVPNEPDSHGTNRPTRPGEVAPGQAYPELEVAERAPLVATTDRPDPAPDRSSEGGALLDDCLAETEFAVIDPPSWRPVLLVDTAEHRHLLIRSGDHISTCVAGLTEPTSFRYQNGPEVQLSMTTEPMQGTYMSTDSTATVVFGLVRPDVATVTVTGPDGAPLSVTRANGAFGAVATTSIDWQYTAELRDASGQVLYRGPLLS